MEPLAALQPAEPSRRWVSLTARLVVTAVTLVAVVCLLIGALTTLAMRSSLMDRLDSDVRRLPTRVSAPDTHNRGPGTLLALIPLSATTPVDGGVLSDVPGRFRGLSDAGIQTLLALPRDARIHSARLAGFGGYRIIARRGQLVGQPGDVVMVTGLPTAEVDSTIHNLVGWEALLTLLGVAVAAGAGTVVVRRQLGPLREVAATAHAVAALPLASGAIEVTERVPARLTDEATEVGQVGAALNTLIQHVEASLRARHRSEQQVRQFVADASHELRTPLTTIRGYTELAQRRPEDAAATTTALAKVQEESARMSAMVEDLLLLARLDSGRPLERQRVDLTQLLLEALSDARVVAPEHHWRLTMPPGTAGTDPEDPQPVHVTGDRLRLHQVVTNLLTNARKYTPAGTTVTVTVRPDGFSVHDDGPGFPAGLAEHAFERFSRGDHSRHRDGGAGLGLSLVQAIVTSHGGSVALASRPGSTTVTVALPG